MKTFGHIKTFFPTDAFVDVIFEQDGDFYTSQEEDDIITEFEEVKVSMELVSSYETNKKVEKGDEKIVCFVSRENRKPIYGGKSEVYNRLIDLLKDDCIHPLAKCEIAGEYYLNGKIINNLKKYLFEFDNGSSKIKLSPTYFLISSLTEIRDKNSLVDYLKAISNWVIGSYEEFILIDTSTIYIWKKKVSIVNYRKWTKNPIEAIKDIDIITQAVDKSLRESRMFKMLSIIKDNKRFRNAAINATHVIPNQLLNTYLYKDLSEYKGKKDSSFVIQAESRIENQMANLKSSPKISAIDLNSQHYHNLIEMTRGIMENKEEQIYG